MADAPRIVKNVCPLDCPDTCSMQVTVRDGVAVDLRGDKTHPFTRGFLCQKMARYLDRVYSPERILHPLRRVGPKGSGRFEPISWDAAISAIAGQFRASGNTGRRRSSLQLLRDDGQTPGEQPGPPFFREIALELDGRSPQAGGIGYEYTCGLGRQGADPMAVPKCRLIINWGSNTAHTNSHLWSLMIEARKASATIVTIEPRTAARPPSDPTGTHPARPAPTRRLALGLMHVIWRDNLQDDDYLHRGTIGHEQLRQRALDEYPPDKVAALTSVDATTIEDWPARYATEKPSLIRLNYGLQRTGRRDGGPHDRLPAGDRRRVAGPRRRPALDQRHVRLRDGSADQSPTCPLPVRERSTPRTGSARPSSADWTGPRWWACTSTIPTRRRWPPASRCWRASGATTCSPSSEQFPTDTVDYADIVLPATTQLEHEDILGAYGHHFVMHNPAAIEPRGESRSNNDVFRALASAMGLEPGLFPDDATLIREALDGGPTLAGITLEAIREAGSIRLNLPGDYRPFADGKFPTPSGKCEFYCERMEQAGLDPLPTYIPPHEDPQSRPDLSARYPLQLLSPPRPQFLNSTFANSPSHRKAAGEPTIELSAEDAEARSLAGGDWAEVFNDRGRFLARVELSGSVRPGVAVALGIYWNKLTPGGTNANSTTSSALTDMGGGATFFDNLVEVRAYRETDAGNPVPLPARGEAE
ncbi:MAG: molybdopterin-dependent oxidoreductase [Isosphaeraceae bacterium]